MAESENMSTFVMRGRLAAVPHGVWLNGHTKLAYVEVGDQRFDDCWVADYLLNTLENQAGNEVELSLCRLDKHGVHLCAIKKGDGKIERIPDPSPALLRQMIVSALLWGVITFMSTLLIAPIILVIPIYAFKAILFGLSESILAPLMIFGALSIWAVQLIWILYCSKKLSPKVRLRIIQKARTAFN
ncbi:hypothetical protein GJ699_00285 [Duganella sp. FT80W]|uniref:Uncharacterized protein n=1 Tax=Duganella guangzhouensis TaxID=2666084 RepID=A0A6I2KSI6_9BURK|nr:hypothetical protein [Duganella guangzhouensis]MRW88421.1 hypothetical protein [Duganella guangzhouensis]